MNTVAASYQAFERRPSTADDICVTLGMRKGDVAKILAFMASEKEVVEDLILAAIKEAQRLAEERMKSEMAKMTEGLGLPPGIKLPF